MVVVDLKIQIGAGASKYCYRKPILVDKDAEIGEVCEQLTALVKLPKEAQIRADYNTIIYSLVDNRKLMDTRLVLIIIVKVIFIEYNLEAVKRTISFFTSKIILRMMKLLLRQ